MYNKITKKEGKVIRNQIAKKDIPKKSLRFFRNKKINYVEEGICPDFSNFRGYYSDKDGNLTQITGSTWEFVPSCGYERID